MPLNLNRRDYHALYSMKRKMQLLNHDGQTDRWNTFWSYVYRIQIFGEYVQPSVFFVLFFSFLEFTFQPMFPLAVIVACFILITLVKLCESTVNLWGGIQD